MRFLQLPLWLVCVVGFLPAATPAATPAGPQRWAQAIDQLLASAATQDPPADAVLFVGSSSIRRWATLAEDFSGLAVINRGFGGSQLADSVFYLDRLVLPSRPRAVVLYAGDNDLAAGKSPDVVAADFEAFSEAIHAALPATRVFFIAIKPSPRRWALNDKIVKANSLVAAKCATDPRRVYVDIYTPMLDASGQPRVELYAPDALHLSPEGYALWTQVLSPLLRESTLPALATAAPAAPAGVTVGVD